MNRRVLVVGFGNTMAGDDGAGIAVVERLARMDLPRGVHVEVGDTDSLRLPALWRGEEEIWLVDAVVRGSAPGTLHRVEHDKVLNAPQRHATAHALSLPESLRWIALAHPEMAGVRYLLWGVEPASLKPAPRLSEMVARAVPEAARRIREELAGHA